MFTDIPLDQFEEEWEAEQQLYEDVSDASSNEEEQIEDEGDEELAG